MKRNYLVIGTIFTLVIACAPSPQPFDAVTAQKEIETMHIGFSEAFSKGDSVGVSEFYTSDAKMLSSNPPAISRDMIRANFGGMIKGGVAKATVKTLNVWGNSEYLTEEAELILTLANGQVVGEGKLLVLWKKENGKWKILRDMFNSNQPVAVN